MEPKHPQVEVQLTGQDGNAFNLIGLVSRALKKAGLKQEASQFCAEAMLAGSYDDLLQLCMKWVTVS